MLNFQIMYISELVSSESIYNTRKSYPHILIKKTTPSNTHNNN